MHFVRTDAHVWLEAYERMHMYAGAAYRGKMRILVVGAGVLGTFYAAKLSRSGHDVTVLARGPRLAEITESGLIVEEPGEPRLIERVAAIDSLAPDDSYDLVVVLVRNEQAESVLPFLSSSRATPNVLFMYNNVTGPERLIEALGGHRVILGFPGAGGERCNGVVRAMVVSPIVQRTTVGELDGRVTPRIQRIADALRGAGFPTDISTDMDAWLKTHITLVSPIANAVYGAAGDMKRLARTRDLVVLMVRAIREGFAVLRALGIGVTPRYMEALRYVPEPLLVWSCQILLRTSYADLIVARHANSARGEMAVLANDFAALAAQSGVPTPAIDHLRAFTNDDAVTVPDRSSAMPMRLAGLIALISGVALFGLMRRNRSYKHNR